MTEYEIVMDECDLDDAQRILEEADHLLRDIVCRRPGYSEIGAALVYLAKAKDMIDITKGAV